MLDVIADFWKPVKKTQPQEKLQPEQLQIGSTIGFGFVPQANLSGRRLDVSAINTYQFGDEALTSFVMSQDKEPGMSMIVAESDGEHYLAISRRIPINDRLRLFDSQDLESIMTKADAAKLPCKDNIPEYKNWVVSSYKREIHGLKGRIFIGDFRKKTVPSSGEGLQFDYTLLVSESNEHAIEIEKYNDGRVEVYATIYRRMNDVGEITHPSSADTARPDIKLASGTAVTTAQPAAPVVSTPAAKPTEAPKAAEAPKPAEPARPAPIKLQEFTQAAPAATPIATPPRPENKPTPVTTFSSNTTQETKPVMTTQENAINGARNNNMTATSEIAKPKLYVQPTAPESFLKQEVKTVNNGSVTNFDADAIECELRVANKIIDEAIRNEMRLTDIVRRIIELPVAYQESVQIPVTLTDEDYALLGIRYGIPASDRNAIKRRIIEDLNDFSGAAANKKLAA